MRPTNCYELWGYPGAGKSTVARILRGRFTRNVPKIQSFKRCVVLHPAVSIRFLFRSGLIKYFSGSAGVPGGRRLAKMALRQVVTLAGSGKPFLLEEGITHEIWRMLYSEPALVGETWWHEFIPYAGPTVLVLNVGAERALQGVQAKEDAGRINLALRDVATGSQKWTNAITAYSAVLGALQKCPKVSVVLLEARWGAAKETCARVAEMVGLKIETPASLEATFDYSRS